MSKLQSYDIDAIRAKFLEEQKNKNVVQNEQKEFSPYEEEMKRREEDLRRREEVLLQKVKELEESKQESLVNDEPKEQTIEDNIDEPEEQVTEGDDVDEPESDIESESEGEGESGQEPKSQSDDKEEQEGAEDSSEDINDQVLKDAQSVVKFKPLRRGVRSATSDINKTTAIRDFPLVLIEEAKSAGFFPTLGTYKDFIIAMCALPLTDMDLSFLPDHIVEAVKAQRKDTRQYTMGEIDEKVSVIGTMCNQMYRSILGIELGTVYLSGSQHLITGQSGNLPKRLSEINYKDQDYVDGVKKLRQDGNDLYNKLRLQAGRPIK